MKSEKALLIDFTTPEEEQEDRGQDFLNASLVLDSEKNDNQSEFVINTPAFCRYFSDVYTPYNLSVNLGEAAKVGEDVPLFVEEFLTFVNTKEQSLNYMPFLPAQYNWVGRVYPESNVIIEGRNVKLPEEAIGLLKVSYHTTYDSIRVDSPSSDKVLLVVNQDDIYSSLVIPFVEPGTGPGGGIEYTDVNLYVKDFCSDYKLEGALVVVSGPGYNATKTTNSEGRILLERLIKGQTYTLIITRAGYTPSDQDSINNGSFIA